MRAQFFFVWPGVGRMLLWQNGFLKRLMGGMRQRVVKGVVPGILKVTVTVHARPPLDRDFLWHLLSR